MTNAEAKESMTRLRRAPVTTELSILVGCHTFVCALPTRFVTRLALSEDLEPVVDSGGALVRSAGESFSVSNLGDLLALPPLAGAWVLLKVPHKKGTVSVALRTGPCFAVREVGVEAPLPAGLFEARGEAVLGAFVAATQGIKEQALYGLVLDATRLWREDELEQAARSLRRGGKAPHG